MPRILGVDLPENKKTLFALTSIYGVGRKLAERVTAQAGIDPDKRARDLTISELSRIQKVLEEFVLEGDLRRLVRDNIERLKRIRSYRGARHAAQLPTRGQRTRTNSRSARGGARRRTVGSMSKEQAAKIEEAKTK